MQTKKKEKKSKQKKETKTKKKKSRKPQRKDTCLNLISCESQTMNLKAEMSYRISDCFIDLSLRLSDY